MTICSMTGFARADGAVDAAQWLWEGRSVNGKGLDIRLRLPSGFERLDPGIRKAIQGRMTRGNLSLSLDIRQGGERASLQVNEDLLDALIARCEAFGETPRLDRLLTVRGVVEPAEAPAVTADPAGEDTLAEAVMAGLDDMLDRLIEARSEEGGRIASVLRDHIGEIEALVEEAENCGEASPEAIRDRLYAQIRDLLPDDPAALPPDRLAQEAALLAVKADVREELDRLRGHIEAARDLLRDGGAVGRRFDFLCQEFNREANTLASKSAALALTRIGLNLKAVIDRLREQVQNVE